MQRYIEKYAVTSLMINNLKNPIIEYSADYSDYSILLFLRKSLAIIPNIRNTSEYSAEDSDYYFYYF